MYDVAELTPSIAKHAERPQASGKLFQLYTNVISDCIHKPCLERNIRFMLSSFVSIVCIWIKNVLRVQQLYWENPRKVLVLTGKLTSWVYFLSQFKYLSVDSHRALKNFYRDNKLVSFFLSILFFSMEFSFLCMRMFYTLEGWNPIQKKIFICGYYLFFILVLCRFVHNFTSSKKNFLFIQFDWEKHWNLTIEKISIQKFNVALRFNKQNLKSNGKRLENSAINLDNF